MRTSLNWIVMVLACLLPAGCASSTASSGGGPQTVRVGFADNGRTVRLHPGDVVVVRLHSTYWGFRPVPGTTLLAETPVVRVSPGVRKVPGSGAGTVTVAFHARHRGRATIGALRRSCGEAMRCVGRQGHFTLHVVVG